MSRLRGRAAGAASVGVAVALILTGCGVAPFATWGMGSGRSPNVNHADLAFVMMMIPHHQEAVDMVEVLLRGPAVDEEVATLARDIGESQTSEIRLMRSWLDDWGVTVGMSGHGGMMSDDNVDVLENAAGADANAVFLSQMIEHHEDAILMAEAELSAGENMEVLRLATRIIVDQSREIGAMAEMLGRWNLPAP